MEKFGHLQKLFVADGLSTFLLKLEDCHLHNAFLIQKLEISINVSLISVGGFQSKFL